MKLRDLRGLYQAPHDDLEDFDDLEDDHEAEAPTRPWIGVDPALAPDATALTWQCTKCDMVVLVNPPPQKAVFVPLCPKCDACALCKKLYDEHFDPLDLKGAMVVRNRGGEIVHDRFKLCAGCVERSQDYLRALSVDRE